MRCRDIDRFRASLAVSSETEYAPYAEQKTHLILSALLPLDRAISIAKPVAMMQGKLVHVWCNAGKICARLTEYHFGAGTIVRAEYLANLYTF